MSLLELLTLAAVITIFVLLFIKPRVDELDYYRNQADWEEKYR